MRRGEPAEGDVAVPARPAVNGTVPGTAGAPAAGARVEAQQLAGYVVGPWQVDGCESAA